MRGFGARRSRSAARIGPIRCGAAPAAQTTHRHPTTENRMYPSREARELAILLRISRQLDICGDITATVDNPSELLAWATILTQHSIRA